MKASTAELKNQMKKVNLSVIGDVMDDMSELFEDSNEMSEVQRFPPLAPHPLALDMNGCMSLSLLHTILLLLIWILEVK